MKVKVTSRIPVRVGKETYTSGQVVEIDKKYFDKNLFASLEEKTTNKESK